MRRRQFFALGLGAGLGLVAAGCGSGRVSHHAARTPFSVAADGDRWADVAQALTKAARQTGFALSGQPESTRITVTGLPALSSSEINAAPNLVDSATPLARLAGEAVVLVVPADSHVRDFDDLGAQLIARPGLTPLAGGPQGEPEHLLFGLIARGLGADARGLDYTGYPTGQEVAAALLGRRAVAAAGTVRQWRADLRAGRVRALAVSCARRVPGLDAPSLLESGVRVDFADWSAAVGPQGMTEEQRAAGVELCERAAASDPWRSACRTGGWTSIPLTGADFDQWLTSEIARTRGVLRDLGLVDTSSTTCWGGCGSGH